MKLVVLTAPSGSGKTTIARRAISEIEGLQFSTSATTRSRRRDEKHGVDYFFLTTEQFRQKIDNGAFVEYEEVYPGLLYGTLKNELERLAKSSAILLDIDVAGALSVKQIYGDQALTLFVRPPSIEILRERLEARGSDSAENIDIRLKKAAFELKHAEQFDEVIVNDDLERAVEETIQHIRTFLVG